MRRMAAGICALVVAAGCSGNDTSSSDDEAGVDAEPAAAEDTTSTTVDRQQWGIPDLELSVIGDEPGDLRGMRTDGQRLYAYDSSESDRAELVRLDLDTGEIVASRRLDPPPEDGPFGNGGAYTATGDEIVLLDGDRSQVEILDPDTLETRAEVVLPADSRPNLAPHPGPGAPIWIGYKRYEVDQLDDRFTIMGTSRLRLDPPGLVDTRELPACGTRWGIQPDDTTVVAAIECAHQIAFLDLATDEVDMVPGFQIQTTLDDFGGDLWASWDDLGYLARVDVESRGFETLDLASPDGPGLRGIRELDEGAGWLWASALTTEAGEQWSLLHRIDPERLEITGRAWHPRDMVIIGDRGYTYTEDRRLASFDPASVDEAAPAETVRPELPVAEPYEPGTPEEADVVDTFSLVFDPDVPNEEATPYLEDADEILPVRTGLVELAAELYDALELVVTDVTVADGQASLAYTYLLNGAPAFFPFPATLEQQGERWIISRESVCRLAKEAGVAEC